MMSRNVYRTILWLVGMCACFVAVVPPPVWCCGCSETGIQLEAWAPSTACVGERVRVYANAWDYDLKPGTVYPYCETVSDCVSIIVSPAPPVFTTPGMHQLVVRADDCGSPVNDPITLPITFDVCVVDSTLQGVPERLFYRCEGTSDSATISVNPPQCPATVTWTVTGPLEKVSETDTSVTVRATDPAPGQCAGTVTCAIGGGCSRTETIRVIKPTSLVEASGPEPYVTKYTVFDDDPCNKDDNKCSQGAWYPECPQHLYGWYHQVCYRILDQCGQDISSLLVGGTCAETWTPPVPGMQTSGSSGQLRPNGFICDCIGLTVDGSAPSYSYLPMQSTQTLSVFGCLLRTNAWTIGNTSGSYTSSGP